jgi:hypothetical protein
MYLVRCTVVLYSFLRCELCSCPLTEYLPNANVSSFVSSQHTARTALTQQEATSAPTSTLAQASGWLTTQK